METEKLNTPAFELYSPKNSEERSFYSSGNESLTADGSLNKISKIPSDQISRHFIVSPKVIECDELDQLTFGGSVYEYRLFVSRSVLTP